MTFLFPLMMRLKRRRDLKPKDFKHLIKRDDPTVLEVGCNGGEDTARFIEAFPAITIHCFEPDERAEARFRSRFGLSDGETTKSVGAAEVHLHPVAVGAKNGEVTFHVSSGQPPGGLPSPELPEDWDLSGSIKRPTGHLEVNPWVKFAETRTVPLISLDHWKADAQIAEIDLIWADVQGAEGDLIAGGRETLDATRFFYTECTNGAMYDGHVSFEDMQKLLPNHQPVLRYDNDALFKRRH